MAHFTSPKERRIHASIFIAVLALLTISVSAQNRDMVKENKYVEELRASDATMVPLFIEGTRALDNNNYGKADSLYAIINQRVPGFIPVMRRLGSIKYNTGQKAEGLRLCEQALAKERSSANIITLAQMLINSEENSEVLNRENRHRAIDLLNEGKGMEGSDDFEYTALMAQAAIGVDQVENFKDKTRHLINKYPDKMISHYYAAIMAANESEWIKAEDEILIAQNLGMDPANVKTFLDSGIHDKGNMDRAKVWFLWLLLAWALGFVVLYIVGVILSNYTLKAIEKEFKTKQSTGLAHYLRSVYKFLINGAGIYYYFSLPVVLLLVVALVGGIIYLFLMAGTIPIKITLLLVIGACVTIYSMIRSLLIKVNREDPGRSLEEAEAPALFKMAREVAADMNTRPIDEIRITPETDLAVYEKGSWREKLRDKGKRILILGTGVLKDFKQNDFKAVLAHEYGHFSHGDTAGGAIALRVRDDMHKYYVALYNAGQAVAWNLGFQFIRLYDFIFRRISNGATRLQEILADRVAAQTYGAQAFQGGLTHVIKRNIEFVKLAHVEIEEARKINRPFSNLYELVGEGDGSIHEEYEKSLNRMTSDDDTHPSPIDRFRFIEGLGEGKSNNNQALVSELFTDWNALTAEMTKKIEDSWKNS